MSGMSKITIIAVVAGIAILLKSIKIQKPAPGIGAYDTNNELTKLWGKKALYTAIPGLGMATTIFDSLKAIAKNNNNRKGVRRYGR